MSKDRKSGTRSETAATSKAPPKPTEAPRVGPTLDLSKYRSGTTAAPAVEESPARERGPRVEWGQLGGIDGIRILDVFQGTHDEFGPWTAARLAMPDDAEAVAVTGNESQAGVALVGALRAGLFDKMREDGSMVPVPVHVRARMSPTHPTGRPMAQLTFG